MFSVMLTYPENRLRWREVPSLGRPFWEQHNPDFASKAAILSAKVYTKIFMCAEPGLERAVPRPGCSGLSLGVWGTQRLQQRLAASGGRVMLRDQSFGEKGDFGCSVSASLIGWEKATES